MAGIERVLLADPPAIVLVQGNTNTVIAGAPAAAKLRIPVGHVEPACGVLTCACPGRLTG